MMTKDFTFTLYLSVSHSHSRSKALKQDVKMIKEIYKLRLHKQCFNHIDQMNENCKRNNVAHNT